MSQIVQRLIETNLPVEFGDYVRESGSDGTIRGDIAVIGPSMDTIQADLIAQPMDQLPSKDEKMDVSIIAKEARALLGLSGTDASLLADAFGGNEDVRLLQTQSKCCIGSLCNFHRKFSGSEAWDQLCTLWDEALQCLASRKVLLMSCTPYASGIFHCVAHALHIGEFS